MDPIELAGSMDLWVFPLDTFMEFFCEEKSRLLGHRSFAFLVTLPGPIESLDSWTLQKFLLEWKV